MPHHLIGTRGIARMLGLTRQRVTQLAKEPGFPEPEVVLETNVPIWATADIRAWAQATGRELRE